MSEGVQRKPGSPGVTMVGRRTLAALTSIEMAEGLARGSDELLDQLGRLSAGRRFDAAGRVDSRRPDRANCASDVVRIQPTRQYQGRPVVALRISNQRAPVADRARPTIGPG